MNDGASSGTSRPMAVGRARERGSIAIACIVHVMLVVLVWRAPIRAGNAGESRRSEQAGELDIEPLMAPTAEPSPSPPAANPLAASAGAEDEASSALRAAGGRSRLARVEPEGMRGSVESPGALSAERPGSTGERAASSDVVSAPAGSDGWSFDPTDPRTRNAPGGGMPRYAGAMNQGQGGAGPSHGMADALDTQDAQRGLGPGGAILTAVEDIARASLTPEEGNATFSVVVYKNGDVHAALVGATSGNEEWQRILATIEEDVKKKRLHIPETAAAMIFEVQIESSVRWADGRKPANAGTRPIVQGLSHEGLVMDRMPMVGVSHENKVCTGAIGVTPAGPMILGVCSPENLGQSATRHVGGRITNVTRAKIAPIPAGNPRSKSLLVF